jgi:hypothetical protein
MHAFLVVRAQNLIGSEMNNNDQHERIGAAAALLSRLRRQRRATVATWAAHCFWGCCPLSDIECALARKRAFRSDYGLIATGVVAAISSLAFAIFMISEGSSPGTVKKEEIAGFFARGLLAESYNFPGSVNKFDNRSIHYRAVDDDVTGSISMRGAGVATQKKSLDSGIDEISASAKASLYNTYVLRFVHRETALLQSNRDYYIVRRGKVLPGAGKVLSIARRGKQWILMTPTRTFVQVIKDVP